MSMQSTKNSQLRRPAGCPRWLLVLGWAIVVPPLCKSLSTVNYQLSTNKKPAPGIPGTVRRMAPYFAQRMDAVYTILTSMGAEQPGSGPAIDLEPYVWSGEAAILSCAGKVTGAHCTTVDRSCIMGVTPECLANGRYYTRPLRKKQGSVLTIFTNTFLHFW